MQILFVNGSRQKSWHTWDTFWTLSHIDKSIAGLYYPTAMEDIFWFEDKCEFVWVKRRTIVIVKQPKITRTLYVLIHEFKHYLVDVFLGNQKKYHDLIDKK